MNVLCGAQDNDRATQLANSTAFSNMTDNTSTTAISGTMML